MMPAFFSNHTLWLQKKQPVCGHHCLPLA